MAKVAKEVVFTDKQKDVIESLDSNLEKVSEYKSAAAVVNKIDDVKEKITETDIDNLINFYENEDFSYDEKETLELNRSQQEKLAKKVVKLKKPEYALKVATQDFMIQSADPALTKLISKNKDTAVDYAIDYYQKNVGAEDVDWCADLAVDKVRKNLVSKKPSKSSYQQLAKFIYETQPVEVDDETDELKAENYDDYIKETYADTIFGTDEQIERVSNEKKKKALITKKENFIKNIKEALVFEHDTVKTAEIDASENSEIEADENMRRIVENLTTKKFNEKFRKQIKSNEKYLEGMKKRHPNDYDEYVNKLRQSRTYKKYYKKYMKKYSQARAQLREEAVNQLKQEVKMDAKQTLLNKNNKNEQPQKENTDDQTNDNNENIEPQENNNVKEEPQENNNVKEEPQENSNKQTEEKAVAYHEYEKPLDTNENTEEKTEQEETGNESKVWEAEVLTPEQAELYHSTDPTPEQVDAMKNKVHSAPKETEEENPKEEKSDEMELTM